MRPARSPSFDGEKSKEKLKKGASCKFSFVIKLIRTEVIFKEKWEPHQLMIEWSRNDRKYKTSTLAPRVQGEKCSVTFEEETEIQVTLKFAKIPDFQEKEYKFNLVWVSEKKDKRTLASGILDLAKYADVTPETHKIQLELTPAIQRVIGGRIWMTVTGTFMKSGAMDEETFLAAMEAVEEEAEEEQELKPIWINGIKKNLPALIPRGDYENDMKVLNKEIATLKKQVDQFKSSNVAHQNTTKSELVNASNTAIKQLVENFNLKEAEYKTRIEMLEDIEKSLAEEVKSLREQLVSKKKKNLWKERLRASHDKKDGDDQDLVNTVVEMKLALADANYNLDTKTLENNRLRKTCELQEIHLKALINTVTALKKDSGTPVQGLSSMSLLQPPGTVDSRSLRSDVSQISSRDD
eukprot:Colp12_sorted_trinity150504_noHs@28942